MTDETEALSKTLAWTSGIFPQSGPEDEQRVALAYQEALELVGSIPARIVACFERVHGKCTPAGTKEERPPNKVC
jgi:hypothetical protein